MDRHRAMIAEIEAETASTTALTGRKTLSARVLAALLKVRRDAFVRAGEAPYAYDNRPLPIGHNQTISQPFIVAIMTEILDLEAHDIVLEIGTGSGYQAAILAELARQVYTIEAIRQLAAQARTVLARAGCANVEVR